MGSGTGLMIRTLPRLRSLLPSLLAVGPLPLLLPVMPTPTTLPPGTPTTTVKPTSGTPTLVVMRREMLLLVAALLQGGLVQLLVRLVVLMSGHAVSPVLPVLFFYPTPHPLVLSSSQP